MSEKIENDNSFNKKSNGDDVLDSKVETVKMPQQSSEKSKLSKKLSKKGFFI